MDKNSLYRFFEGQASIEEMRAVKEWAESSEEHSKQFHRERKLFNAMILIGNPKWTAINTTKRNRYFIREFLKIASVIIIAVSITATIFSITNEHHKHVDIAMQTIIVPAGQRVNIELPDGSNVWLNAGTQMQYPVGEFCPILYKKERVELLYHGQFWYSETPDKPSKSWNSFCNRICTWGKFKDKKTDKYFFFFSSHFDHVSNEARVNSAKLLVQKVQEIAGDLPYFCTGDLNCDPDEEPISFILNSGLFKDSYSISETTPKGPAGTLHYWNFDFNPEHRIDYILVEKSIKVLSFETITDDARQGRFSSDHYPIMIKAEL